MTSTLTIDTEPPVADVVVGAPAPSSGASPNTAAHEVMVETEVTEATLDLRSAGEIMTAQIKAATALLKDLSPQLVKASSNELTAIAAAAAGMVAAANAAQAAIVLEADSRGVIAASDFPRVAKWVEQSCVEGGAPVARSHARRLSEVAIACSGYDVEFLREAVVGAQIPLDTAASTAKLFRRVKPKIDYDNWDDLVKAVVDGAIESEKPLNFAHLEDQIVSQFGRDDLLDDEHERLHDQRHLTGFRRDRHGMLAATIRLDPASEAVFSAAITSLAAPHLDEKKEPDPRSAGQRRADALITLAGQATTPAKDIRGSGANARVIVTIGLDEMLSGLSRTSTPGVTDARRTLAGNNIRGRGIQSNPDDDQPATSWPAPFTSGRNAGDAPAATTPTTTLAPVTPNTTTSNLATPRVSTPLGFDDAAAERGEHGCGTTAYGHVLSPTEVRILACDAHIVPATLGTNGELLDIGRAKRLITPGIRDALHLRDGGCTYPGCGAPPRFCDGHHIHYWALGGPTDMANLALLCRHHHTVVHRYDHTASIDDTGVHWIRGDGSPIGNTPRFAQSF